MYFHKLWMRFKCIFFIGEQGLDVFYKIWAEIQSIYSS